MSPAEAVARARQLASELKSDAAHSPWLADVIANAA